MTHRTTAPTAARPMWRILALCLCFALAPLGQALAASKAASGKPQQYETLPESPPAGADRPAQPLAPTAKDSPATKDATASKEAPLSKEMPQDKATATTAGPIPAGAVLAGDAVHGATGIKTPADFNECVRVALVQSPMLVKSALEIESRRLDVQDAWSTFIPTVSINTTYWFKLPPQTDSSTNSKPYTIGFSTGQWNPILSGFEVQARNEMTNMAILAHLKVIGEGLRRLAMDFLQLQAMAEQREIIRKKQDMATMNLNFFKTRQSMGQATQLDLRIAETRVQMAKAEEDKLFTTRQMVLDDIKFILGVPFSQKLELKVENSKQQILGKFAPADVTDDKVRAASFDLRMAEYEKRLQKKNIGLSYVKMMPSFGFTFQTQDALSSEQRKLEKGLPFYPGLNITMPLDVWTKGRDVARQYKKLDQVQATTRAKDFELMVTVQKALSEYQGANSDLTLATAKSDLAKLQDEQTEYRHKTGQVDFDRFMTDRLAYFDDYQKMILVKTQRDIALLTLKHLSGDLQSQYVDVTSWEK